MSVDQKPRVLEVGSSYSLNFSASYLASEKKLTPQLSEAKTDLLDARQRCGLRLLTPAGQRLRRRGGAACLSHRTRCARRAT